MMSVAQTSVMVYYTLEFLSNGKVRRIQIEPIDIQNGVIGDSDATGQIWRFLTDTGLTLQVPIERIVQMYPTLQEA